MVSEGRYAYFVTTYSSHAKEKRLVSLMFARDEKPISLSSKVNSVVCTFELGSIFSLL